MATIEFPDEEGAPRPGWSGPTPPPPGFGANSPRLKGNRRRPETPEIDISFSLPPAMLAAANHPVERQLARLDSSLAKWTAMVPPVLASCWPSEMFGRVPAQSEIARRWNETFKGLNLVSLSISCDVDTPSPWRVRRAPYPENPRVAYDLFLPQFGNYLNVGFDANPPEDCGRWLNDVATFCTSVIRQVYSEKVVMTCITGGVIEVGGLG